MKKITIITLFLVAFIDIKAQVDPQVSYPIINGNIRDKYIWTHTGGIGRFTVDDIVRTARNGVNGQDSTGLGGNLTQPTQINQVGFPIYINNGLLPFGSGQGTAIGQDIDGCEKKSFMYGLVDNKLSGFDNAVDTCYNIARAGFVTNDLANDVILSTTNLLSSTTQKIFSELQDNGNNVGLLYEMDKINGFVFSALNSFSQPFNGTNLIEFRNSSGTTIIRLTTQGRIVANLPTYVDDATADADVTLPSGSLYLITGDRAVYTKP